MKICIVAEGCYPYVVGGVSGWINNMITVFPNVEFVVLAIISDRTQSGKFQYELPENVSAVYEAYLDDFDWEPRKGRKRRRTQKLNPQQYSALRSIIMNYRVEWPVLFDLFQQEDFSVDGLLMGEDFYRIVQECYDKRYSQINFSDFLWTMRSIYLPLCLILHTPIPEADLYHCVATGYAGVLGSMAKYRLGSKLLISEHGIYTREREEEILKASWVQGVYKNIWIEQFRKMSVLAYDYADTVTSLYGHARELQIDLGCHPDKTMITPNGIRVEAFENLPGKTSEDQKYIHVGAILRVTPIKDVKTMIRAFAFAKERVPRLKLWIMGPCDEDREYANECYELVEILGLEDVVFTGRIRVSEYLGRMDFTILTSISEGQPLTILESFAAKKPVIATAVGNCRELIYGEEDDKLGKAGFLTHIMNVQELTEAMVQMAENPEMRRQMGEVGYQRVKTYFRIEQMQEQYRRIYESFSLDKF